MFLQYSFGEVLSTRRYRSDSNQNYLDMKLGNLMVQKIVRIETELVGGIGWHSVNLLTEPVREKTNNLDF